MRQAVHSGAEFAEQRMFGGLAVMVNTRMACGLIREDLTVRVGADGHDVALAQGASRPGHRRPEPPTGPKAATG